MRRSLRASLLLSCCVALAAGPTAGASTQRVDWGDVTLPRAACAAATPIHLHNGHARVSPIPRRFAHDHFYGKRYVTVDADGPPLYGHLEPTSLDAGLNVLCSNGGGTADGELLWSWVIFRIDHGRPSVLGLIAARTQPAGELPTLLRIAISRGTVTAHEAFYGPYDGTCCSTGRAITMWTYSDKRLTPGTTVITQQPRSTPIL